MRISGEDIWCQGYSEPAAGSDLAALRLSATLDGGDYILNGTKLLSTGANFATHMFCLVRTSSDGPKQSGITFLLLPMNSPGLQIAPIVSISGDHELNQVYFDKVRVPVTNRIGDENDGWRVAKVLMQFARSNNVNTGWVRKVWHRLPVLVQTEPDGYGSAMADDPETSRQLAEVEIALQAVEVMEMRGLAAAANDVVPGAFSSILKTPGSEVKQRITELAMLSVAFYGIPFQPEVQRDVLAKRVLGL